jgi:hypothetical protein
MALPDARKNGAVSVKLIACKNLRAGRNADGRRFMVDVTFSQAHETPVPRTPPPSDSAPRMSALMQSKCSSTLDSQGSSPSWAAGGQALVFVSREQPHTVGLRLFDTAEIAAVGGVVGPETSSSLGLVGLSAQLSVADAPVRMRWKVNKVLDITDLQGLPCGSVQVIVRWDPGVANTSVPAERQPLRPLRENDLNPIFVTRTNSVQTVNTSKDHLCWICTRKMCMVATCIAACACALAIIGLLIWWGHSTASEAVPVRANAM